MDPPPRSFAADAHDCIMVRSSRINRIQGCGAISAPAGELPSNCRRLAALQGKLDQPSLPPCSWPSRASRFAMACSHPWPSLRAAAHHKVGRDEEMVATWVEQGDGKDRRSSL